MADIQKASELAKKADKNLQEIITTLGDSQDETARKATERAARAERARLSKEARRAEEDKKRLELEKLHLEIAQLKAELNYQLYLIDFSADPIDKEVIIEDLLAQMYQLKQRVDYLMGEHYRLLLKRNRSIVIITILVLLVLLLIGLFIRNHPSMVFSFFDQFVATSTPTPTPWPTPSPTPTLSPSKQIILITTSIPQTAIVTPAPTLVPTVRPTPEPTTVPTARPTPKPTPTPTPTSVPTPKPTPISTIVPTPKPTNEPMSTPKVRLATTDQDKSLIFRVGDTVITWNKIELINGHIFKGVRIIYDSPFDGIVIDGIINPYQWEITNEMEVIENP